MSQEQPVSKKHEPLRQPSVLAGFLSYLIPGLGQIYQGRFAKGILFAVCLLGMFHFGQWLGDWRNVYLPDLAKSDPPFENNPWHLQKPLLPLANIIHHRWHFAGQFWIGIAAWPAIFQYNNWPIPVGDPFLQNFQKMPNEVELNEYLQRHDKTPDLAWVYTVIAGMLNILVIYDAFAGPAYGYGMGGAKPKEPEAANPPA